MQDWVVERMLTEIDCASVSVPPGTSQMGLGETTSSALVEHHRMKWIWMSYVPWRLIERAVAQLKTLRSSVSVLPVVVHSYESLVHDQARLVVDNAEIPEYP